MNASLSKTLTGRYPILFKDNLQPFAYRGVEVDDGWFDLLDKTLYLINNHVENIFKANPIYVPSEEIISVQVLQIKEKLSQLVIYLNRNDDYTDGVISLASHMSQCICEKCGTTRNVSVNAEGWRKAYCADCRKNQIDQWSTRTFNP
jgi:hypothetical protein